jgi:hypothetical protein
VAAKKNYHLTGEERGGGGGAVDTSAFSPDDIKQGALGDCWLLAAIATVSTQPQLWGRVFQYVDVAEAKKRGIYAIRLCVDGVWETVVVDDRVPWAGKGAFFAQPVPVVGQGQGDEGAARFKFWVAIIEKAFAKRHSCYEAIEVCIIPELAGLN